MTTTSNPDAAVAEDPTTERIQTTTERKPRDGRLVALAVLETLAGEKTPTEASESLGVSLTYYYTLENRALEGLVKACKPKPKGRQWTAERELAEVRKENGQLRREVRRAQAVARAAQRSLELAPPPKPGRSQKATAKKKGRRKKKASVRALKAVRRLQSELQEPKE